MKDTMMISVQFHIVDNFFKPHILQITQMFRMKI